MRGYEILSVHFEYARIDEAGVTCLPSTTRIVCAKVRHAAPLPSLGLFASCALAGSLHIVVGGRRDVN